MAEKISRSDVQDVIDFSSGLMAMDGFYSPFLSNQLLTNLNNNPRLPSAESVKKALNDYKNSGEELQGFVEFASSFDMIFKRTLYSYANALSFDLQVTCKNAYTENDYQSDEYKKDRQTVDNFLTNFDYKKEFYNVLLNVLKRDTYFTWFRKTKTGNRGKMKFALQIMPQDYCMLTGYFEKGLLWSLNILYYMQPGVDLNGFDPSITKTYLRALETIDSYVPSAPLNDRKGSYAMWADVSPLDGAWAWKFDTSSFANNPFLSPYVANVLRSDEIGELQYNKDLIAASGILAGEIKLFDSAKSGQKANQFSIDPKTLGTFMSLVKKGLQSTIKAVAVPLENIKFFQFEDKNPNSYTNELTTTAGIGTGISRVIYSSDKMSNAELEAALNEVYQTMKPMYAQFNNFLDFYVNQMTSKYKFKFEFVGSNYQFERDARFDKMMKMADKGLVLNSSAWASAVGMNPVTFDRMLAESKYTGWIDKYSTMMLNANTSSYKDNEGGRERKNARDLTESGEASRETLEE
nr:MAG TPA_asm: portal protein [Caudoviricetes sp.]